MKSFEEWLDYQKLDPASLPTSELAELRKIYEEGREREDALEPWTLDPRLKTGEFAIAIAFRDGSKFWLALWIRRSRTGDVFVFLPRSDRKMVAHASYHRDGRLHQKSYGAKLIVKRCQKLDLGFSGLENIVTTPIEAHVARGTKALVDPSRFSDTLEVPIENIEAGQIQAEVDLVEPGRPALSQPWTWVTDRRYVEFYPEILVTLWDASVPVTPPSTSATH